MSNKRGVTAQWAGEEDACLWVFVLERCDALQQVFAHGIGQGDQGGEDEDLIDAFTGTHVFFQFIKGRGGYLIGDFGVGCRVDKLARYLRCTFGTD